MVVRGGRQRTNICDEGLGLENFKLNFNKSYLSLLSESGPTQFESGQSQFESGQSQFESFISQIALFRDIYLKLIYSDSEAQDTRSPGL